MGFGGKLAAFVYNTSCIPRKNRYIQRVIRQIPDPSGTTSRLGDTRKRDSYIFLQNASRLGLDQFLQRFEQIGRTLS